MSTTDRILTPESLGQLWLPKLGLAGTRALKKALSERLSRSWANLLAGPMLDSVSAQAQSDIISVLSIPA